MHITSCLSQYFKDPLLSSLKQCMVLIDICQKKMYIKITTLYCIHIYRIYSNKRPLSVTFWCFLSSRNVWNWDYDLNLVSRLVKIWFSIEKHSWIRQTNSYRTVIIPSFGKCILAFIGVYDIYNSWSMERNFILEF